MGRDPRRDPPSPGFSLATGSAPQVAYPSAPRFPHLPVGVCEATRGKAEIPGRPGQRGHRPLSRTHWLCGGRRPPTSTSPQRQGLWSPDEGWKERQACTGIWLCTGQRQIHAPKGSTSHPLSSRAPPWPGRPLGQDSECGLRGCPQGPGEDRGVDSCCCGLDCGGLQA